ncbi:MAG: hypothetical protein PHQ90_11690 [Sulfuricurvum sp.]|uniref:hypothetical protein n=1 Tax=Sulfuricurvum sp. TaxID=2025608 RepID=UPI0026144003|nr:hypothetical protein [Sulfuricurvum sp.]MDD2369958.1 hypothetical protein [Sulfuricurvum sp.]MDD2950491.1 hypothetical protein [Sulfuricurvum sp.]MDD5117635.1 hypothetical protein [Sulfuricurvum sp.]
MKKIILLFLVPFVLWGTTYDLALLQIGVKIFPKVALMEQGTKERIQSNVNFVIVAGPAHKEAAQRLIMMFERQYGGVVGNYSFTIRVISPKDALEINNTQGFILLMEPDDAILSLILEHAHKNKILTFSFDSALLQKGTDVSLYIGRSVKPYINLSTLKQVPFTFEYGFLKLSQPY